MRRVVLILRTREHPQTRNLLTVIKLHMSPSPSNHNPTTALFTGLSTLADDLSAWDGEDGMDQWILAHFLIQFTAMAEQVQDRFYWHQFVTLMVMTRMMELWGTTWLKTERARKAMIRVVLQGLLKGADTWMDDPATKYIQTVVNCAQVDNPLFFYATIEARAEGVLPPVALRNGVAWAFAEAVSMTSLQDILSKTPQVHQSTVSKMYTQMYKTPTVEPADSQRKNQAVGEIDAMIVRKLSLVQLINTAGREQIDGTA